MAETLANFSSTTLNTGINNSTLTIILDDATTFPSGGNFRIRIDDELVLIASRSTNTLTATTRGIEGTSAASHSSGVAVYGVVTRTGLETFIEQEAADAVVGGQVTGTVGAITVANSHGASGTLTHHAQTHTVSEHTTAVNISDEGSAQGAVNLINFVGSGVAATVSSTTATVTISGGGGGSSPPFMPAYVVASNDAPASVKAIADATCDQVADQVQFNTAVTAATGASSTTIATAFAANPRGGVLATAGRFTLSGPVLMKRAVNLSGMGAWTLFIPVTGAGNFTDAGNGTGGAMFKLASGDEQLVSLSNFYMYGNYNTGFAAGCLHGVYFDLNGFSGANWPVTSPDPVMRMMDLTLLGFDESSSPGTGARNGIYCANGNAWGSFFTRCRGKDISGNGFFITSAADSHVTDCAFSAGCGFYFNGGNNTVSQCKSWFCNGTWGFRFASGRSIVSNLTSQDDFNGIIFDAAPSTASNLIVDTWRDTGIMVSSNAVRVDNFTCFNRGNGNFATSGIGLDVDAAYHDVHLVGSVDSSNTTSPYIGASVATRIPATTGNWARVNVVSSSAHTIASTGLSIGT